MADILAWTHVDTIFGQGWHAGEWGFRVASNVERGFHVVTRGEAWLKVDGHEEMQRLGPGDVAQVNVPHELLSDPGQSATMFSLEVLRDMTVHKSEASTGLICGAYVLREAESHPLFDQLPDVLLMRAGEREPGADHVIALMIQEASTQGAGMHAITSRLVDVLLCYILRHWLASSCPEQKGWVAALRDPMLSQVLSLLHNHPEQAWTIDALAARVHTSRATLIRHFTQTLDTSVMTYLREVRMQRARQILATSRDGLDEVALRVGYADAFSLSKAYKQWWGHSPSDARVEHARR